MKSYKLFFFISIFYFVFVGCDDKVTNAKSDKARGYTDADNELYRQRLIEDYKLSFLRDCIFDNLYDKEAKNAFYEADGSFITDFPHSYENMRALDSLLDQVSEEIRLDSIYGSKHRFNGTLGAKKRVLWICAEYYKSEEFDSFVEKTIPK